MQQQLRSSTLRFAVCSPCRPSQRLARHTQQPTSQLCSSLHKAPEHSADTHRGSTTTRRHRTVRHAGGGAATPTHSSVDTRAGRPSSTSDVLSPSEQFDVVVIGSGVGGLSSAALAAYYGFKVVVLEAHSVAGGAAHTWTSRGCHFDSGTALFFGLPAAQQVAASTANGSCNAKRVADNPLAAVLNILGESIDVIPFGPDRTTLVFPQGRFTAQIGSELFPDVVRQLWGSIAQQEWLDLSQLCRNLAASASGLHPVVVRYDPAIALTAGLRRPAAFAKFLASQPDLMKPHVMFSQLVSRTVSTPALRDFLDVLCKGTSGAAASALPAAYVVRAFAEMYQSDTQLQWPRGGPSAIVDALVRGLRKHGGKLVLNSPVAGVLEGRGGRAAGVKLGGGGRRQEVLARRAVVSNASLWDTAKLCPPHAQLHSFSEQVNAVEAGDSFVHLHAVVDDAPTTHEPLPVHSYFFDAQLLSETGWPTLTIGTAVDPSLAPPGKQILHAYMAEPYSHWAGLTRGSAEYKQLKAERAEQLWGLVEQVVPGARQRLDWFTVGSPLTHRHFRRRHQGSYGIKSPLNALGSSQTPAAVMAMEGLYCVGDTTFPFVGTPAVAASGMWVANSLAPWRKHWAACNVVDQP